MATPDAEAKPELSEKQKNINLAEALHKIVADAQANFVDDNGKRSKTFTQDDLLATGIVSSAKELMPLIAHLSKENLFRTVKQQGRLAWNARPRDAARQITALDRDERAVYVIVEEAHDKGIWVKEIKKKAQGVAQQSVQKAVNKMEKANLIKSVKSVRHPTQKTYMLSHLVPSEDVIGNSFFDAGDLDESFRDELLNLIVFHVRQTSWGDKDKDAKKGKKKGKEAVINVEDDGDAAGKKRKRTADIEDAGNLKRRSVKLDPEAFSQTIYRAGTHTYPTAEDIHNFLVTSNAIKPTKAASLTVHEIQGCIDVLCWDEKLEKIMNGEGTWGYRTVRGITFKPPGAIYDDYEEVAGTGLTQAPCGRCPVHDLCHEGGPVNPQECIYLEQWLRPA